MTDYEIKVPGTILSSLLCDKNGLAELVEAVLNQIMDSQAGALLAEIHEDWQGRRYLAMDECCDWAAEHKDSSKEAAVKGC